MLNSDEKAKVEKYINKISEGIYKESQKFIQNGMSDKKVIERVVNITVKKFTPESKMIISSVYNTMMEHTLAKPFFQTAQNKAAFYERNILKDLNTKFLFDVPKDINYESSKKEINKWIAAGAIVIVGGVICFPTKSLIPIDIAVVVAGVMLAVPEERLGQDKQDISKLVQRYLNDVTKTMMEWLNTVQEYYDERVVELEKELM